MLTFQNEKQKCSHIDFMVKEDVPDDYCALVTGLEGSPLYVCPPYETLALKDTKLGSVLCKTSRLDKPRICPDSLFFGH